MSSNKKINILFLCYSSEVGGAEYHIKEIIESIDKDFFNIFLISNNQLLLKVAKKYSLPYYNSSPKNYYDLKHFYWLIKKIKRLKIDLLQVNLFKACIIGRLAGKLAGVPIVVSTIHGSPSRWPKQWLRRKLDVLLNRITANYFCDQVIAVSETNKKFFVELEKIKPEKITVIPNSINLNPLVQRTSILGVSENDKVIGTTGRLSDQKGLDYLINALPSILTEYPNTKLVLVGDGPLKQDLVNLVIDLNIQDKVIFLSKKYKNEIPGLLLNFDIFILSSLWEGLSTSLLESMLLKIPVITTELEENKEVVKHNSTGMLVPTRNHEAISQAVINSFKDGEKTQRMARSAYHLVKEKYSGNKRVKNTIQLYNNLLEERLKNKL